MGGSKNQRLRVKHAEATKLQDFTFDLHYFTQLAIQGKKSINLCITNQLITGKP